MNPAEELLLAGPDDAWQEETARFLLGSGFWPGDSIGKVRHKANAHREGRTFASVWHVMRKLVEDGQGAAEPQRTTAIEPYLKTKPRR